MRRAVEVLTAYVGSEDADLANQLMNRIRDEGPQAFTDLTAGLLFVSGFLLVDHAAYRGQTALEALQDLALKVADGE